MSSPNTIHSPRKKLKIDSSPSLPPSAIPESPINHQEDVRGSYAKVPNGRATPTRMPSVDTRRADNFVCTKNTNVLISSDEEARVRNVQKNTIEFMHSTSKMPMRPNAAIRRAGFPSQSTNVPGGQNPDRAHIASNSYALPQNVEYMRQHAQAYAAPANLNVDDHFRSQGHIGQFRQQHHQGSTYTSQYQHPGPMSSLSEHLTPVVTSMANQYSTNSRPRQRLIQRASPANSQSVQSTNYPNLSYYSNAGTQQNQGLITGQIPQNSRPNFYNHSDTRLRPPQPYSNITASQIAKLAEVFPHLPDMILRMALTQAHGNVDDAQALIVDDRVTATYDEDLYKPYSPQPQTRGSTPQHHGQSSTSFEPIRYAQHERILPSSTKRNMKAPNLSIREKQALRTAQTYPGQLSHLQPTQHDNPYNFPPQHPVQYRAHSNQHQVRYQGDVQHRKRHNPTAKPEPIALTYEAPKLRTRAARKGPKIDIGSEESADDTAIELESDVPDEPESESDDEDDSKDVVTGPFVDLDRLALESRVLHYISVVQTSKELADLASCTNEVANFILENRPFANLDEIRALELQPSGKRVSRTKKSVGSKVVEMSVEALEGYEAIDFLVAKCENYGREVKAAMSSWGFKIDAVAESDGALGIVGIQESEAGEQSSEFVFFKNQPALVPDSVRLKDYQLFGVSWLHLMYQKDLSGILADEMGLGKTCQVITFLGVLLERGVRGPHLIVVPASTLENWLREISRFCPSLKVEAYYGSQKERDEFRDQFEGEKRDFNVMVTTYQLATGAKDDRSFLRRQSFDVCVYDEGHNLKNSSSSRYKYLMAVKAHFRVLLTGTPLQNNLKELISLLAFVLPKVFAGSMDRLDSIFKIKAFGDSESLESALLSQQRIKRAKTMMTPFILRRYKKDVLTELPQKKYQIDFIDLNEVQQAIYKEISEASRKSLTVETDASTIAAKDVRSAVNVMMQLRKCSNHPMLFRRSFNDRTLKKMAKAILREEIFKDSEENLVFEDMEVMTDFELNRLCLRYPSVRRFALEPDCWMQACKVQHLQKIIPKMKENGDRILLFSQFTQTLDILEDCMDTMGITYFRLDGSTDVSARQDLIDQFHEESDITVFLLSTKAGGFGINLACANVVIIYDSSFNPHDDKQAEDRAHRVGQTKEVEIIRLVTRDTIEEHIARLASTKLTLDSSVSGGSEAASKAVEDQAQRQIAQAFLSELRS